MATTIQSTTESTSISTGALVTLGGVGIAKNLYVGGSLSIEGDVSITGIVTNEPLKKLTTSHNLLQNEVGKLTNTVASIARAKEYQNIINDMANLSMESATNSAIAAIQSANAKNDSILAMNDAIAAKIEAVAKAGEAAGHASLAATSATNAANSATGAGNSASASANSASQAGTYATNAGNSASLAQTKSDLAAASESAAGNSATAAANSATSASTSATNAANSATAAVLNFTKLSAKIDLVESLVGAASANLTDTLSVLVDANSQTAQHLETLESNYTANLVSTNATITNLQTTITTGDSANATAISNLTATVGTKNKTFRQGTAPTATASGDIWIDTSNGNLLKIWDGSAWVSSQDLNKTTTYYSGTAPTATAVGDLWIDTANNNVLKRWNGSAWVEVSDTRIAGNSAAITNEAIARANGDSANASSISTLSTTVGGHTTSISTLTSTTNGLNARWGVTVNNNGSISGIVLNSTGSSNGGTPTSAVVIAADKFAVVDPFTSYASGNTPPTANCPFEIVSGITILKAAAIRQNISSYNFNPATNTGWNIDRNGNILTYGNLEIRDSSGSIVLSTGGNMDFNRINGSTKPENNATYGANGSNLSISHSGNMLPNSDFVSGIQNWVITWNAGGGTNYTLAWDLAGPTWAPAGGHTIGVVRNGTTQAASSWFDVTYDKYFPMQAGITFELSAYLAAHRCGVEIRIAYYNSSYTYISETGWGTTTPLSGGNDLNNWNRFGGIAATPANTAYVRIWVRGGGANATDPYFWATKIFFGLTKTGQTQLSPWSAATSSGAFAELNQINGSNAGVYIANAAIGNALIANLHASKIDAKTLTASKIVNNSLNKYTSGYVATGASCPNNTLVSVASFSKTFTHRDALDNLMVTLSGTCDSGTIAMRVIGFYITGSAYYWYGGWDEYRGFGFSISEAIALEAEILAYSSASDGGCRSISAVLQKEMLYHPNYNHTTDYATYAGNILITGTCTFHFILRQNSGASKTPTEITFTVMDTYA